MTGKPTAPALAREVRDLRSLLAVVLDALTLDHAVPDYDARVKERAALAKVAIHAGLTEGADGVGWNTDWLRSKLTAEEHDAAEREKNRCRRCHRPFAPTDARHDGHARHGETPWCRACVDNCHEGSAVHVCVICDPARYRG